MSTETQTTGSVTGGGRKQMYNATGQMYETERYGESHMRDYLTRRSETLASILARNFGPEKRLKILDVGCGTGLNLQGLSALPARHELSGMDFSATMLNQAREKAEHLDNPPELVEGSAYEIPFPDKTFDVVCSTRFIHQFTRENKRKILNEMFRVTKDGGAIAVEFYGRPYHVFRWYAGERKRKADKQEFYSHFPTIEEVNDVVGRAWKRYPVRLAGSRVLYKLFGNAGLNLLTNASGALPLRLLLDEYFVFSRK